MELVKPPEKPKVNILVMGPPKSGKSVGAGTAPGGVLYNNFDLPNATRLVHRRNPDGRIMEPKLPEQQDSLRHLFAHMMEVAREVRKPGQTVFESTVVDTVGELYRRLLEEFSNRSVRPTLPTYGEVSVQVERFCRMLCEAPTVNTVLVCHELLQQNGEEMVSIPFTGTKAGSADLGSKLASMVDILAYTTLVEREDKSKECWAQLIPAKGRNAGDRFDCLGDMRPFNVAEWIGAIEKHERGEPVPQFSLLPGGANVVTEEPEPKSEPPVEKPKHARKVA